VLGNQLVSFKVITICYAVFFIKLHVQSYMCLQCFDAVGWVAGRASGLWKTEWWGAGVVICLERGADLHTAQLMPLSLTVSCFSKIQIGFTFLVPAHLGSPRQKAIKRVCVYMYKVDVLLCCSCHCRCDSANEIRCRQSPLLTRPAN